MMRKTTKRTATYSSNDEIQVRMDMLAAINAKLVKNPQGQCRIPGSGCLGSTARNHSIQEEGILSEIAETRGTERHVLKLTSNVMELANQTKGHGGLPGTLLPNELTRIRPRDMEILIGDASVAYFACYPDDSKTFEKIEPGNGVLPDFKNEETLFQFPWRALLFRISEVEQSRSALVEFRTRKYDQHDRNLPKILSLVGDEVKRVDRVQARLNQYEAIFWDFYKHRRFSEVRHVVRHIPSRPSVAVSEFVDLLTDRSRGMICAGFTVYPHKLGHFVVLSYLESEESLARERIDSLVQELDAGCILAREALSRELLRDYRNVFISPEVYRSLSDDDRTQIEVHLAQQWNRLSKQEWGSPPITQGQMGSINLFAM